MKRFIVGRLRSLACASAGLMHVVRSQRNAWIHLGATVCVVAAAMGCRVSLESWVALVVAITMVWMAEAFNTALELLADAATPGRHPLVGLAKDAAAAAVLLAALGAVAIGGLVFWPAVRAMMGR